MNLTIAIMLFAAIATNAHAQEVKHAPTVWQCQSDEKLWHREYQEWISATDKSKTTVNALGIGEILNRQIEMTDCTSVVFASLPGQSTGAMDPYLSISQDYANVALDRYSSFLRRHHLLHQLAQEDAAGAR